MLARKTIGLALFLQTFGVQQALSEHPLIRTPTVRGAHCILGDTPFREVLSVILFILLVLKEN